MLSYNEKPGVSISPELGSVPGCDRHQDGQTERHTNESQNYDS